MAVFPKPKFPYAVDVKAETKRLRAHRGKRAIPDRAKGKVLAATWNIANFGAQEREKEHLSLIGEIVRWFDLVAIQECRENHGQLAYLQTLLPKSYRYLCSDASGNDERMAFLYDSSKLTLLEEIGEIAFPVADLKNVALPGVAAAFQGFDRTPYLASFRMGSTSLVVVNVHLYYGKQTPKASAVASMERRSLETYAVARWASQRQKSPYSFTRELMAMGDFNMPRSAPGDPVFDALTRLGLQIPAHSSQIASSIASDASYDQVAFFPGTTKNCFTGEKGVFDFDTVVFPDLWQGGANATAFKAYLRYYLSDHRPMWVQLSY